MNPSGPDAFCFGRLFVHFFGRSRPTQIVSFCLCEFWQIVLSRFGSFPIKSVVPNLFGTRDQFRGRQFFHGQGGEGGLVQVVMQAMGSDAERQMKLHLLASPPTCLPTCPPTAHLLLSARFLTGCGPVPVHGRGVGDPCSKLLHLWA